jgi:hypothetical protein
VVEEFFKYELKMTPNIREKLEIEDIFRPRNKKTTDVVYVRLKDSKSASLLWSQARFIQSGSRTSLVNYIPSPAFDRFKAVEAMAYQIRTEEDRRYKTDVRLGKTDFILRKKDKKDLRIWRMIDPEELPSHLPQINYNDMGPTYHTPESSRYPTRPRTGSEQDVEEEDAADKSKSEEAEKEREGRKEGEMEGSKEGSEEDEADKAKSGVAGNDREGNREGEREEGKEGGEGRDQGEKEGEGLEKTREEKEDVFILESAKAGAASGYIAKKVAVEGGQSRVGTTKEGSKGDDSKEEGPVTRTGSLSRIQRSASMTAREKGRRMTELTEFHNQTIQSNTP